MQNLKPKTKLIIIDFINNYHQSSISLLAETFMCKRDSLRHFASTFVNKACFVNSTPGGVPCEIYIDIHRHPYIHSNNTSSKIFHCIFTATVILASVGTMAARR